jgi:hypothetical protein
MFRYRTHPVRLNSANTDINADNTEKKEKNEKRYIRTYRN